MCAAVTGDQQNATEARDRATIKTTQPIRRSQYDVGIGYGDNIEAGRKAILEAIATMPGLEADPKPEVLVWDLGGSSVNLRVRWWTHSKRTNTVHVQAAVLEALKQALDKAGIDMLYPTQVMLLHDQTEDTTASGASSVGGGRDGSTPLRPGPRESFRMDARASVIPPLLVHA